MHFLRSSRVKERAFFFHPVEFGFSLSDDSIEAVEFVLSLGFFLVLFTTRIFEELWEVGDSVFLPHAYLGRMDLKFRSNLGEGLLSFDGGEGDLGFLLRGEILG